MKCLKVCFAVLSLSAMVFAARDVVVGGGVNMSTYLGDDAEYTSPKLGFNVGASYSYPFKDKMGLLAGVNFVTKGAIIQEPDPIYTKKCFESLGYLAVPVQFSFSPIPAAALNAGLEIGLLLAAESKTENTNPVTGAMTAEMLDLRSDYSPFELGLAIGTTYIAAKKIVIGAGYTFGLTKVSSSNDINQRNSNLKVNVGYLISL